MTPSSPAAARTRRAARDSWSRRPTNTGCCSRSWDSGRQPLFVPDGDAGRHVLIDRHQQIQPAQILVANADRRPIAELLLDFELACREYAFCRSRSIVVRLTSVTEGTDAWQDVGEHRRPACVGERLTPI